MAVKTEFYFSFGLSHSDAKYYHSVLDVVLNVKSLFSISVD